MHIRLRGKTYIVGRKAKAAYRAKMLGGLRNLARAASKKERVTNPIDLNKEFEQLFAIMGAEDSPFGQTDMSPRDRIIAVTSFMAELMRWCITIKMAYSRGGWPSQTGLDGIFEGTAPLSTFADRIRFCAAFGLLSPDIRGDLGTLKDIRNELAHSFTIWTWNDPWLAEKAKSLILKFPIRDSDYKHTIEHRVMCSSWSIVIVLLHIGIYLTEQQRVMSEHSGAVNKKALDVLRDSFRKMGFPEEIIPPDTFGEKTL